MIANPFLNREVWFLTGTQDLYGEDTLRQVSSQSQNIVTSLNAANLPIRVVWKPSLKDKEGIQKVINEANSTSSCVGVILWMHTFSPAKMWIAGLSSLQKPLLHLHTQANIDLPWSTIDMDFMNLNQAAHGDREFGYMCTRLGISREVVVGHASNPEVHSKLDSWIRAAIGRCELQTMKLVRFGDNMRNVGVTEGDKTEAELVFGPSINTWSVNDLAHAVDNVSDDVAHAILHEYESTYTLMPSLQRGGKHRDSLLYASRLEAGMRSFLESGSFTGFTTNFEDLGELRQLPGLAVQRLMYEGYGFGAEGDWKTAILVRLAKVMGYGRNGGASLMEDYTYNLEIGDEKILGAHMLEVCPSLTKSKPSLEIHPLSIGDREDPVRLKFDADSGDGLVVAMSDMRDRFRLTANHVKIVEPNEPMTQLPVASAVWVPQPNLSISAECWILAGAAHHTCMTTNTKIQEWEMFCAMTNSELLVINDNTTTSNFKNEMRWNNAYYRMVKGI